MRVNFIYDKEARDGVGHLAWPFPMMMEKEIDKIISYLEPNHTMLECGAGGSTIHFSPYVEKYISLEQDANWYNSSELRKILEEDKQNVEIKTFFDWESCANAVDDVDLKLDRVLIDGRMRALCAFKTLPHLNDDALVFIHDFYNRPRYHAVLEWYEEIDGVHTSAPDGGLVVLRKK